MLPRFVGLALEQGYRIVHQELLVWMAMPTEIMIPMARLKFLALEAMFTFIFFASFETRLDSYWTEFMPWDRENVATTVVRPQNPSSWWEKQESAVCTVFGPPLRATTNTMKTWRLPVYH
jgi:hypothetical protein